MGESHLNDPYHILKSSELLLERSVAKERESGSSKDGATNDIPACQQVRGSTFEAEVSKLVMRLVRGYDQHKRAELRKAFQKAGGRNFSDSDWLQHIYKGSNRTRCQYCKNSRDVLLYNGAIPGRTSHVTIPYKWKEFLIQ